MLTIVVGTRWFLVLVSRHDDLVSRHDEILSRHDEIISRQDEIVSRQDEIVSRHDEIKKNFPCPFDGSVNKHVETKVFFLETGGYCSRIADCLPNARVLRRVTSE